MNDEMCRDMTRTELRHIAHKARNKWFVEFGIDKYLYDSHTVHHIPMEERERLLGRCHENAPHLSKELLSRGIDAQIVHGGLHFDDDFTPPQTRKEASERGAVHFWVCTDEYHIDMVSEPDGMVRVFKELPSHYIPLKKLSGRRTPHSLLPSNINFEESD